MEKTLVFLTSRSRAARLFVSASVLIGGIALLMPAKESRATSAATAKCLTIVTPIKEISGFKKTKQKCSRDTMSGNTFVFSAKSAVEGTDLANESFRATAKLLQNLNRSLVKSWSWRSDGLGTNTAVTQKTLKSVLNKCVDVFSGCLLSAWRLDDVKKQVSYADVKVEWVAGKCTSEPYCGGWSSSNYRMKLTVTAHEEFWE